MGTREIAALVLAALGVAFAVLNFDEVKVNWVLGNWRTPLIVVIALSMVIGAALGFLVSRRRD
ncbi:MAG TPA: LapA family protein [Thermoleophilaceae bacterium]|nr:LapA family protein [Thermoleophilaceae bacterium]